MKWSGDVCERGGNVAVALTKWQGSEVKSELFELNGCIHVYEMAAKSAVERSRNEMGHISWLQVECESAVNYELNPKINHETV